MFCRLRVNQDCCSTLTKWQKRRTTYFPGLTTEVPKCAVRRKTCFDSRYKYTAVDVNRLIVHKFTKGHDGPRSCRYFSDDNVAGTRKTVSKKMEEIKENVLTIPNGLCLLRMVATPFLGYLVLQEWYATSLGLFIFAGFTDVVDGYIARNYPKQQSMIGSFLDPAADKILIATLFVTLTVNGLIPVPLTSLIISRDICLMGAGFYIRYVSLPPPKTVTRYFDMSFVTAKLSPTGISKVNTLVQLSLVACSLAAPVFDFVDHAYLQILWYVTAASTVLSAGSYLCYKDTYKVLTSRVKQGRK